MDNNNNMTYIIKDYIDYLVYVGILNASTRIHFENILHNEYTSTTHVQLSHVLQSTLTNYIINNSNNTSIINQMAMNVYMRYITNKRKASLKGVLTITQTKQLMRSFMKWKVSSTPPTLLLNINEHSNERLNTVSYSDYLYTNYNPAPCKQDETCDQPSYFLNYGALTHKNFITRMEKFNKQTIKNREIKRNETENIKSELCPFTPTIYTKGYNYVSKTNNNAFKRLYDDSNRRNKDYVVKQDNALKEIKQKSEWKINKKNKYVNNSESTCDKLYNDYKVRLDKKRNLQREIDKERGISFKPNVNKKVYVGININDNNDNDEDEVEMYVNRIENGSSQ